MNQNKPKIAVIIPKYGLLGGAEHFAFEMTERIAREGYFEIHVFANKWRSAPDSSIIFHKVPAIKFPRFLRPYAFAWFVHKMISREKFDLIHAHERVFYADVVSLHCMPHVTWVKNVEHNKVNLYDRSLIAIEKIMLKNGAKTCFFTVSSFAENAFRSYYKNLPGKWEIMHPGVNVQQVTKDDRNIYRKEIRARYGISDSTLLLLFVSMNFETKGLDTVLETLAKALYLQPLAQIKLLVVGRGDEHKYGKMARSLCVENNVIFAGVQNISQLAHYYQAADVLTLFSLFEPFGMVVLEAMSAYLPVIITPNVGAKDVVTHGLNGFILPNLHDVDTAAKNVVQLLDSEVRESMGVAAYKTATNNTWDNCAQNMATIYFSKLEQTAANYSKCESRVEKRKFIHVA